MKLWLYFAAVWIVVGGRTGFGQLKEPSSSNSVSGGHDDLAQRRESKHAHAHGGSGADSPVADVS